MAIGLMYRPFVELAETHGVPVDEVLARFGMTREQLFDPHTRLSPDQGRTFARALFSALPGDVERTTIGLRAAERFVRGDADLLGYILEHSAHGLATAMALAKFGRLIGDSADFQVDQSPREVVVWLGLSGGKAMLPEAGDFAVAAVFRLLLERSGGFLRPSEVRLPRPKPAGSAQFRRFFGARVIFDAPASVLVYPRTLMLRPFVQGDHRLVEILTEHAAERERALPRDDWQDRVRTIVVQAIEGGELSIDFVAQRCGLSARTLRRRLEASGSSFRAIVDEVRKERALAMLDRAHTITDVAQQLGFADTTALARAFRRWTGVTPQEHRRALRGARGEE